MIVVQEKILNMCDKLLNYYNCKIVEHLATTVGPMNHRKLSQCRGVPTPSRPLPQGHNSCDWRVPKMMKVKSGVTKNTRDIEEIAQLLILTCPQYLSSVLNATRACTDLTVTPTVF